MKSFRSDPTSPSRNAAPVTPVAHHIVHFYDEQEAMVQTVASFLAGGLLRGAPAVVVVARDRTASLTDRLTEMGIDIERATASRQLVLLDSAETLDQLLVDGMPSAERFRDVVGTLVTSLCELWRPFQLLGFGDMVDLLCARGETAAAIELERLWDDLAHRHPFTLYCAYDARQFAHETDRAAFQAVCRHHDLIVPMGGSLTPEAPPA